MNVQSKIAWSKEMLRKCGLFALSLAVLSSSFSVLFSDVSNAASIYDEHLQNTPTANVGFDNRCDSTNIATTFFSSLQTAETNGIYSGQNRIPNPSTMPSASFLSAINNGGRWGINTISSNAHTPDIIRYVNIFWTPDDSLYLEWRSNAIVAKGSNLHQATIAVKKATNTNNFTLNCDLVVSYYTESANPWVQVSTPPVAEDQGYPYKVLFINIDEAKKNYPPGYEGEQIPSAMDEVKTQVTPGIEYEVTDKNVKFRYKQDSLPFVPCSANYLAAWRNSRTFGGDYLEAFKAVLIGQWDHMRTFNKDEVLQENRYYHAKQKDSWQTYQAKDFGTVPILIDVNTEWPGAPYLSCGDDGNTEDFNYEVVPNIVFLDIDGSSYKGSTDDETCNPMDGNFCTSVNTSESIYEDCDALDILCHARNVLKMVGAFLSSLFVPSPADIKPFFDNAIESLNNTLGFLWDAGAMLISAINLLITTATPNDGYECGIDVPVFGQGATIKLCAWRYQFPALWTLMQTAIQAGISVTLVYVFWRKLNKMTGRDVEDGTEIEVNPYPGQSVGWIDERTGERGKIK